MSRRLIVELAGVRDIEAAKAMIKETPFLEFKKMEAPAADQTAAPTLSPEDQQYNDQQKQKAEDLSETNSGRSGFFGAGQTKFGRSGIERPGRRFGFCETREHLFRNSTKFCLTAILQPGQVYPQVVESDFGYHIIKLLETRGDGDNKKSMPSIFCLPKKRRLRRHKPQPTFIETGLSGKNLKTANVQFMSQSGKPEVGIEFDAEGTKLFADLTKENIGKQIAIFLDGQVISAPTVQTEITDGKAVITGNFTLDEAKKLAQRLNEGALPMPITLIGQQSVEASLGMLSLDQSLKAGLIGIILVMIFMIIYYRFLGRRRFGCA